MMECASFRRASFRERRALSVPSLFWQSAKLLGPAVLALGTPAHAVPGGDIGVLAQGRYYCEVPDPVGVTRGISEANVRFQIVNSSSYRDEGVIGSYLRTGDSVALTSGPRKGERYRLVSAGTLQRIDSAGHETTTRCVLSKRNTRR